MGESVLSGTRYAAKQDNLVATKGNDIDICQPKMEFFVHYVFNVQYGNVSTINNKTSSPM